MAYISGVKPWPVYTNSKKLILLPNHGSLKPIHAIPTNKKVLCLCLKYFEAMVVPTIIAIVQKIRLKIPFTILRVLNAIINSPNII